MTSRRSSRRNFLKTSAMAASGFFAAGGVALGEGKKESPNERIRIAGIGVGGKGDSDIKQAGHLGDVVALCDIDDNTLGRQAEHFKNAKKYNDFRKMLEAEGKNIDAVVVSTPDHTHAAAAVMAMRMGKHVYCQKPLTHTVYEARLMRELAAEKKLCTQMGNQGTTENGLRRAVEIIRAGVIGPVREVHVWTNRPIWPQAPKVTQRPKPEDCPKHVHWDEFLGPAPERPYARGYHPFAWRGWWDFGTGALGDMACHTANMAFMALKLQHPTSIQAEAGDVNPETCPSYARIVYEFPARGDQPALKLFWYEGKKDGKKMLPPVEITKDLKLPDSGSLLVGDKGMLYSPNDYGARFELIPNELKAAADKVPETLPRNGKGDQGQKAEWIEAIKSGKPEIALSNFGYAGMLTETVLLGNVAIRVGKRLEWDAPVLRASNCPEADQYIRTEYRKGWTL
jgi:predicted dehydrogenase